MITFERQRSILRLLNERPGMKITDMADLLDVSRGTIRNDLLVLEEQNHVRRVRGGAVLIGEPPAEDLPAAQISKGDLEGKPLQHREVGQVVGRVCDQSEQGTE